MTGPLLRYKGSQQWYKGNLGACNSRGLLPSLGLKGTPRGSSSWNQKRVVEGTGPSGKRLLLIVEISHGPESPKRESHREQVPQSHSPSTLCTSANASDRLSSDGS